MKRFVWTFILLLSTVSTSWAGGPGTHCTDHYGRVVAWVENANQSEMAKAVYRANGAPQIHYNKAAAENSGLSEDAQTFLYNRECAFLVLGHKVRPGASVAAYNDQVDNADCWAANKFYYAGETDKLTAVENEINELEPGKWVNIAGPTRKLNLEATCRFIKPNW